MRRLFLLIAVVICSPGMALAVPPTPGLPDDGGTWQIGTTLSFTANYVAVDYWDQTRLKVRWSSSPTTDANGLLAAGTDLTYPSYSNGVGTFTPYSWERPSKAGAYYWQTYVAASSYPSRPQEVGPVRTLNATLPPGPSAFDPPSGTSMRTRGGGLTFTASGQSAFYVSAQVAVSKSPAVGADGALGSDVLSGYMTKYSDGAFRFTTYSWQHVADAPGTYYWQVKATDYSVTTYSPVQTLVVTPAVGETPSGGITRNRIPSWVGVQGRWSYYVNTTFGIPDEVSGRYFGDLARLSGWRWGLTSLGSTGAIGGGRPDGVSAVSFSYLMPDGLLGLTTTWSRAAVRKSRVCRRGKCRTVRKRVRVVVEQDMQMNGVIGWEQGPPYPLVDTFDLESVLVHEFGHMASPRNAHFTGCRNSPMVVAAGGGEYWRSESDWARRGCGAWAAERGRNFGTKRLALEHRVLDMQGRPVPPGDQIVMPRRGNP